MPTGSRWSVTTTRCITVPTTPTTRPSRTHSTARRIVRVPFFFTVSTLLVLPGHIP
ncbi:hypothetical protein NKG05_23415 [Oerskovia sp. M15]